MGQKVSFTEILKKKVNLGSFFKGFYKQRHKRFGFKKKVFKIKNCYTKSILFVYKKGAKIKKYYTKSIPFIYYTRKKKIRRKSYFWGIN